LQAEHIFQNLADEMAHRSQKVTVQIGKLDHAAWLYLTWSQGAGSFWPIPLERRAKEHRQTSPFDDAYDKERLPRLPTK